jgi:Fibronectin type III domain
VSEYPIAGHSGEPSAPPEPSPGTQQRGGGFSEVLTRKIGPLPVWVWGIAAAGAWWAYNKYKTPASQAGGMTGATAPPGIDPQTGASYAEEYGAAQLQVDQLSHQQAYQPHSSSAASVAAATPTVGDNPGTAPTGTVVNQYPAPTGLKITGVTATSAVVTFAAVSSPTPPPLTYTVAVYNPSGIVATQETVAGTVGTVTATVSGLKSNTKYTVTAWANGGAVAPPGATATFTTT